LCLAVLIDADTEKQIPASKNVPRFNWFKNRAH
jgi:hypothetical protein